MTVPNVTSATAAQHADSPSGLGALRTERGNLPLDRIDVRVEITGLTSQIEVRQEFVNTFDIALEASYVFPLPAHAAVTRMQVTVDGRPVAAELREREAARRAYDDAVAAGRVAAVTEEERPDIFTMRVANLKPGERIGVAITLVNPLSYRDGEATLRIPLVVAPRYVPGKPRTGLPVGDGYADDTDAVPDASRITPPVLLPGFPHPVALSIEVGIDPAGLDLSEVRSNLPTVACDDGRLRVQPGERADRDFILRLRYGTDDHTATLVLVPDADGDEGTYQLTVLPPDDGTPRRPLDLVLVLDRSAGMAGWKMPAARRAAARIIDSLRSDDRFAVLTFADRFDHPQGFPDELVEASDRNRYRAVEHFARVDAAGGKDLLAPLRHALELLCGTADARDAVVVLVTDGHVGNEDQILRGVADDLSAVRVHAVGIDQVANGGFLGRLAGMGGGSAEFVESEDRLDEAMESIHRRVQTPVAYALTLSAEGLATIDDTASPARLPDLYPGIPLVVAGRYRGDATGSLTVSGVSGSGEAWSRTVTAERCDAVGVTARWARAHLRDLEDLYVSAFAGNGHGSRLELAQRIVDTSVRFGVLCRFTAYVASREGRVIAEGQIPHRVLQPVEAPAGWDRVADSGLPVAITSRSAREPRTVKLRNVIAVAVAGLLVLATGWVWSLGREDSAAATRNGAVAGKPAPSTMAGRPAIRGGIAENTVVPAPLGSPEAPQDFSTPRDVVTNGSLRLRVAEPAAAADRLVSSVSDAGGRVDSRAEHSTSSSPMVDLVLRIPADKVDAILADAKKLGAVQSMSIRYTDVTTQRVDLDARIDALQTSVTRLLELMAKATNTADLLSAESSLTQRQAELDSLKAQRTALHDDVAYATITVNLSAEPTVDRAGFLGSLERGWHSLLSTAHRAVLMVGFLIPWLAVLAVPVLLGVVVVVRRRYSRPPG